MTWETLNTLLTGLDPDVSYNGYESQIMENAYEELVFYNAANSTYTIPWLAQNYTVSPDLKTYNFTLRQGLVLADGEKLNSTSVYFSLNRLLVLDGSTSTAHGTQGAFVIQQLLNKSLSTAYGGAQTYNAAFVNKVLGENFVQVTGPLTFTIRVMNPNSAFLFLIAGTWGAIMAPNFVMQHDLSLWNRSSNGYSLTYPVLGGNLTNQIYQYFVDETNTCNAGATPNGCGTTFLDSTVQGTGASNGGSGPYVISSVDQSTHNIVLEPNSNYWGGPYTQQVIGPSAHIQANFKTVNINYVPDLTTREVDIRNAVKSGQAVMIDVPNDHLYDVADRNTWLANGTLATIIPGVSVHGPYATLDEYFDPFETNVTNQFTGTFQHFQPFADRRFRLAFADTVNMTEINIDVNNRFGQVAINAINPGLPPTGSFNASVRPVYSFNLTATQNLLLSAMTNPLTAFTFKNGTAAPAGLFNNTFGCAAVGSNGQCASPVSQSIPVLYPTGDTVDGIIMNQMASAINNISSTYNMGLTVQVVPVPVGQMYTIAIASAAYMYAASWLPDYPWIVDYVAGMYSPTIAYSSFDNWNLTAMQDLFNQVLAANSNGNLSELIITSSRLAALSNQQVQYLWTFYSLQFIVGTSNIHGVYFNPAITYFLPPFFALY